MNNRHAHYPGRGRGPGYEASRDTQWTRNSKAIMHYIDGGNVEFLTAGNWSNKVDLRTLRPFHLFPARIA